VKSKKVIGTPTSRVRKSVVIYIVVWVHSGVPYKVEAYRDLKTARTRAKFFKQDFNPDYDEVGVFEVEVGKHDDEN
jgi:hypothetical protein